MVKIALFDVGDTLVYRKEDDKTLEIKFLNQYLNRNFESFDEIVSEKYKKFQENLFIKSTSNIDSLLKENEYYAQFIDEILQELGLDCFSSDDIREIVKLRFSMNRYFLFAGIYPILQALFNSHVQIGIITNGKPSRRDVLKALGIDRFFNRNLIFISDEMRLQKPKFEFFREVNQRVDDYFKTDNHIFLIDDDIGNCKMADSLPNWRSIHFYPEMNLTDEILNVILNS